MGFSSIITDSSYRNTFSFVLLGLMLLFGSRETVLAEFSFVATHPEADQHYASGEAGGYIKVLRAYNGKIYMGYGQNDGPVLWQNCPVDDRYGFGDPNYPNGKYCDIKLRYLDPATGTLSVPVAEIRAQQADTLEVMGGNLYFLAEDPDENYYPYVKCTSTTNCFKASLSGTTPEHLYSATVLNGHFYIAGSEGYNGAIWRSTDNGSTWSIIHQRQTVVTNPNADYPGCYTRYNSVGSYQNNIYAQAYDYHSGQGYHSTIYNGSSWNSSPNLDSGRRRKGFAGKMVFISYARLSSFNGTMKSQEYGFDVRDFAINGGYLYVLRADGKVYRTTDLNGWSYVDTLPGGVAGRSIEVLNEIVYVGTENSKIYKSTAIIDCVNIVPLIYLLLLDDETP